MSLRKNQLKVKILKSIKKDFVFFDIGANTGWYSMLAALSGESKIISFEPVKEHLECLTQTIFLNKLENRITVSDFAISDTKGEAEILLAGTGSSLEGSFLEKAEGGVRKIKITTLDSYVENNKISSPDFIKIDIEGHEYKALIGAKNTISTSLPILFIEIAYTLKNINRKFINPNYKETFSLLDSLGYQTYIVKKDTIAKYNPEQKIDGVQMYLFLHQTKHQQIHDVLGLN